MELPNTSVLSPKTSRMPNVVAVVPAHNERRFIGSVVIEVLQYVDKVIVVDDGSTDGTGYIAEQAGAIVLRTPTNLGKAKAVEYGFQQAKELAPTAIVMLDGDGQHRPEEIPDVVEPIVCSNADMVIGSRFQGTEIHVPVWRQFGQHALTYLTNYTSGTKSTDSQSGFRAFSPQKLESFSIRSEGFSIESEMQFWATDQNLIVTEVAINCDYDEKPKRNPVTHGLQVLNGIFKLVSESRPLFYFGLIGFAIMLVGVMGWWWTVSMYSRTNEFALGTGLVSTLVTLIGLVSLFQGITLNTLRKLMEKQGPEIYSPPAASVSAISDLTLRHQMPSNGTSVDVSASATHRIFEPEFTNDVQNGHVQVDAEKPEKVSTSSSTSNNNNSTTNSTINNNSNGYHKRAFRSTPIEVTQ